MNNIYGEKIIGTCSICGGPVSVPNISWSVIPPVPRCQNCGATPQVRYGPVIPMQPAPPIKVEYTTGVPPSTASFPNNPGWTAINYAKQMQEVIEKARQHGIGVDMTKVDELVESYKAAGKKERKKKK